MVHSTTDRILRLTRLCNRNSVGIHVCTHLAGAGPDTGGGRRRDRFVGKDFEVVAASAIYTFVQSNSARARLPISYWTGKERKKAHFISAYHAELNAPLRPPLHPPAPTRVRKRWGRWSRGLFAARGLEGTDERDGGEGGGCEKSADAHVRGSNATRCIQTHGAHCAIGAS